MTYTLRRDDAELTPGVYYFYFDAPQTVKERISRRPLWFQDAARYVVEQSGAQVRFLGSGLTHLPLEGGTRTLYGVKLELLGPGSGDFDAQQVLAVSAIIIAAGLGTAIYINYTWSSIADQWIGYLRENDDNANDLTGAIEAAGESLNLFGWAAILLSGAALVYAFSRLR